MMQHRKTVSMDAMCRMAWFDWAEDYYYDADAPEDKKKEERFVPHPYIGTKTTASKTKKPAKEKPKQETSGTYEQMSFV